MDRNTDREGGDGLRGIIDSIPVGICVFRRRGDDIFCISANDAYADMLGLSVADVVGESIGAVMTRIHPDDVERCRRETVSLLDERHYTRGTYRLYNRKKDRYCWLHLEGKLSMKPDGNHMAYFTYTDVDAIMETERELDQSQQALDQSQQALQSILKYVPGGVFVYSADADDRFTFVSENMLRMLGYTRDQFDKKFGGRFSRMVYAEDRDRVICEIDSQIAVRSFDACSYRIEKKDGSLLWVYDEGHIVTDAAGKKWFYVVVVDITSNVQAKDELENTNNELRKLIDGIPVSIIVYKKRGGSVFIDAVNGYTCRMAAMTERELLALTPEQIKGFVYPGDFEMVSEFFGALFSGRKAADITYRTIFGNAGGYQWYRCSAVLTPAPDGSSLIYAVYTDATYQKVREEDFNRIIQELLITNPNSLCAFRLNLTKNLCSDEHGTSEYIRQLLNAETADGLIEKISSIITDRGEAEEFVRKYGREKLLESFAAGRDRISATYHRLTDSGQSHWVTTYFHILKNPYTGDVEAVAYSADSDGARKQEEIIAAITGEEYDYIGLVNAETGITDFRYYSNVNRIEREALSKNYTDCVAALAGLIPNAREREEYLRGVSLDTVIAALGSMQEYTFSYFYIGRSGDRRRKQTRYRYLESGGKEIMFSRVDVTAAFLHEEEYAERLKKALLDAERANEMKSDFLGNVSHDMRTPLNAILGYAGLALQAESLDAARGYLGKIEIAGNTLLSLINDTLDLQKIENGSTELRLAPMRCADVLRDIVTSVRPLMEEKRIEFVIDNSRAVMATINVDVIRVREVIINLLSNAAKFTPEGGRVELIIECTEADEKHISDRITVRDNGIGMSREFQSKMFEPFSQERGRETAHIDGSGLGLAIVRRLVDLMDGTIEVKSELGVGTEFVICLDFERLEEGAETSARPAEPAGDIRGLHILLCEDNEMNMEIARRILDMNGADVTLARDGREGLEKFAASGRDEFDIILMDIRMPVMDGYTATRRIRECAHPRARMIPILAMSADAYASDVDKAVESGMNGHIAKPIDPKKMIAEIARLAGRK